MLNTANMSVIPILSAVDLPTCLNNLRKHYSGGFHNNIHVGASKRELPSHCVSGQPLSERQTNILTDVSSDFKDLMRGSLSPDRKGQLYDFLGEKDAHRLVSYLMEGPTRIGD